MANHTLIIDQGGHSTRAIVFNKKGEPVHFVSEPVYDPINEQPGFVEYDSMTIIDSTLILIERLSKQLKPKQIRKINAVGIVAQRSSIIACQKHSGKPITPMISWQDTRHAQWLENQGFDINHLQAQTGLRLNAHMGASKMAWLMENNIQVKQCLSDNNLLFVPWGAFLTSQLCKTSVVITDPILAARTGLTAYGELDWCDDLLQLFGIPKHCLPSIQSSLADYGKLSIGEHIILVKALGGDQNFIAYAYGEKHRQHAAFLNIGTGAFIQAIAEHGCYKPLLKTSPAINENDTTIIKLIEGTINGAASILDWWQQQLPRPYTMEELNNLLQEINTTLVFINTLFGTGSPYWIDKKTPEFIAKNDSNGSKPEKTVAILESIIFAITVNFDHIKRVNPNIRHIIISGGLSKINQLCQTLADLNRVAVYRYKDSEASARGLIFYMSNISEYTPKEPADIFKPKEKDTITRLSVKFKKYCELMEQYSKSYNAH